jgi:hypothetical protein
MRGNDGFSIRTNLPWCGTRQGVGWVSRRPLVGVTQHGRGEVGLRRKKTRLTRPTSPLCHRDLLSSYTNSRSDVDPGFRLTPCRYDAPLHGHISLWPEHQPGCSQFSMTSPWTRSNSRVLSVTGMAPSASACAAISRYFGPMCCC